MSSDREIDFILSGGMERANFSARGMPSTRHITLTCACGWTATADKQMVKELNKKHLKFERHLDYLQGKNKAEGGEK